MKVRTQQFALLPLAVVAAVAFVLVPSSQAFAASGNIGGRPANPQSGNERTKSIFVKTIAAGESANDAVEVVNSTGKVKRVQVYATDSVRSSGGAFACAQAADAVKAVGGWISPRTTTVTVPADQSVKVPFTINVPKTADVGEQNGCIVIQEQTDPTFQGGIGISFRTAIRVAVLVPGDITKKLAATGLKVAEKGDKVILSPSAKNTGNVSVDTKVNTKIKSIFGKTASSSDNTFPVLRGERAEWNIESNKPFWGGFYIASYNLSYDSSDNFIGSTNNKNIKTVAGQSKLFFAPPSAVALIVELLALAALIAAATVVVVRRRRRKQTHNEWVDYTVKKNENIQTIAKSHNVTWKALARANNLAAPYLVEPGQTIKAPATPTTTE